MKETSSSKQPEGKPIHLMVIGAQKAATTWLQHILDYNDQFWVPPETQEIHFFDRHYDRGSDYYLKLYEDAPQDKITCDVTPGYLDHPQVPARIFETAALLNRQLKFVLICREPVSRFLSAYQMWMRKGRNIDLEELITTPAKLAESKLFDKGLYYKHVKNYLKYFSFNDFLILLFDEVKNNKVKVFTQLAEFVGVENKVVDPYQGKKINSGGLRKYPVINEVFRLGGRLLRFLRWTSLIHKIKRSTIVQKLYKINKVDYELTNREEELLSELKKIYAQDVRLFAKLIDKPNLLKVWDY